MFSHCLSQGGQFLSWAASAWGTLQAGEGTSKWSRKQSIRSDREHRQQNEEQQIGEGEGTRGLRDGAG